jgi:hypothetical protein
MPTHRLSEVAQWRDLHGALDHADQWFSRWQREGVIHLEQLQEIQRLLAARRAEWQASENAGKPPPWDSGMLAGPAQESLPARMLRYWNYLEKTIQKPPLSAILRLSQRHDLLAEIKERQDALALQLGPQDFLLEEEETPRRGEDDEEEALTVFPVRPARRPPLLPEARPAPQPRRNLLEVVLDPRNAQWLLGIGGALMVVGLVILLYVNKLIAPPAVAIGMGLINGAILLGGWWVLLKTRHQIAGMGLTLLACLVMPLNLWYYHAHGLITVDGHLWLAAVVITLLYAASAWILRSELFVFVFVGGLTLTGMLFLADLPPSPIRLWEIASPATLLVVLGLACIHAERAFPQQPGPFSRKRFGLAFFFSGHALLGAGLLLVFGAQVAGHWLYEPVFRHIYRFLDAQPSPIVGELRWLAIFLVAAGTYAYVYSDLVVRKLGVYVYIAAFTLMWLLVLCLELLHLGMGIDLAILVLALAGLVFNLLHTQVFKDNPVTRALPYVAAMLPGLGMMLGLVVYLNAISPDLRSVWRLQSPNWSFVAAMAVTAVSCRVGAFLYRHVNQALSVFYFFATAGATMLGATALLAALGLVAWERHAPILVLLPIAYLVAAYLYQNRTAARPLWWVANAAMAVMLFSSISTAFEGFTHFVREQPLNLILALFFAEAAVFYVLAGALLRQPGSVHLATALGCAAVWQLLTYAGVPGECYALAFAVLGLALLVSYRFAVLEGITKGRYALESFQSANTLLVVSFVVIFVLGLFRLATRDHHWGFVWTCVAMTLAGLAAVALVRDVQWRRGYVVLTIEQIGLTLLVATVFSGLSFWQMLELVSVVMGVVLLVASHIGWYKEGERHNDLVTLGLIWGSILVGLPLCIATMIDRFHDHFHVLNELGFLAAGILLLVSGVLCQLRTTTISGAVLTAWYFLALLVFIPWSRLNSVAWFILVGGTLVFVTGLALSVFREQLLQLPDRIKRREGAFRVLRWR